MSGEIISHYHVLEELGRGGMGVVYRAEDLKLGRLVALKFLSDEVASDRAALDRFEREARAASALNNPGICTIHEIDEVDGRAFIVMELLEGTSLKDRLAIGRLPFDQVIDIGLQIADALRAAHTRGICHRDIKPANVFVTASGRAKLLDFGLAKFDQPPRDRGRGDNPTAMRSSPGLIVGTAAYMSPEQAVGEALDGRSDLFSLGLLLHEMATGHRVFSGNTVVMLNAILTQRPPPPSTLVSGLPLLFDQILDKALEKDRDVRYQTVDELLSDLTRLKRDTESARLLLESPPAARGRRRISILGAVGAMAILAAVAIAYVGTRRSSPDQRSRPVIDASFLQLTDLPGLETFPSLSPDGKSIVFASQRDGNWGIFMQRVDGRKMINLTADSREGDTQPAFSADGERIAFRSERGGGGIFLMGATGESVRRLSDFGYNPTWAPDGRSIACATESVESPNNRMSYSSLWVIDVATGQKRQLTDDNAVQPNWSPHNYRLAYWTTTSAGHRDIRTIPVTGGRPVPVTDDAPTEWSPVWSPDGRYLFFASDRGGSMNLWRVRIDEKTGQTLDRPEPVTTPSQNSGLLTFSHDGSKVAYVSQSFARNVWRARFDLRAGRVTEAVSPVTQGTRFLRFPAVSRDGEWIVYTSEEKVVVSRVDGTGARQLTEGEYRDRAPSWSPDGKTIAFYSNRTGDYQIWTIKSDGSGLRQLTDERGATHFYPTWSPDGRRLAYGSLKAETSHIMLLTKPWSEQRPSRLPAPPQTGTFFAPWSWSATDSSALAGWAHRGDGTSAGVVVYNPESQTYRKITDFGMRPAWLPDSRRLLMIDKNTLFLVDMASGRSHPLALPRSLEEEFAVSPDGAWIYFMENQREGDIWLMTLRSGEVTR